MAARQRVRLLTDVLPGGWVVLRHMLAKANNRQFESTEFDHTVGEPLAREPQQQVSAGWTTVGRLREPCVFSRRHFEPQCSILHVGATVGPVLGGRSNTITGVRLLCYESRARNFE